MRTLLIWMQAVALSAALAVGPATTARAVGFLPPAAPPVAQMAGEEHDHDHGFESDSDPWRNMAAPVLMIAAGLLYLGFVRWQTGRRRMARPR